MSRAYRLRAVWLAAAFGCLVPQLASALKPGAVKDIGQRIAWSVRRGPREDRSVVRQNMQLLGHLMRRNLEETTQIARAAFRYWGAPAIDTAGGAHPGIALADVSAPRAPRSDASVKLIQLRPHPNYHFDARTVAHLEKVLVGLAARGELAKHESTLFTSRDRRATDRSLDQLLTSTDKASALEGSALHEMLADDAMRIDVVDVLRNTADLHRIQVAPPHTVNVSVRGPWGTVAEAAVQPFHPGHVGRTFAHYVGPVPLIADMPLKGPYVVPGRLSTAHARLARLEDRLAQMFVDLSPTTFHSLKTEPSWEKHGELLQLVNDANQAMGRYMDAIFADENLTRRQVFSALKEGILQFVSTSAEDGQIIHTETVQPAPGVITIID